VVVLRGARLCSGINQRYVSVMTEQFERVKRINYHGKQAWRKQYAVQGRRKRMAMLRWLAGSLGMNALLAPAPLSPIEACATEREMIQRLHQQDVLVPQIFDAGDDYLVLSDVGTIFSIACRQATSIEMRLDLLKKAFNALHDLHACGGYLSQAFARNLTVLEGRIGFIDLEEDPSKVMSLPAAQARDILFFVHSTARFMADAPQRYEALLKAYLEKVPTDIRAEIAKVSRVLKYLVPFTRLLGSRGRMAGLAWRQLVRTSAHV
jgi:tRNA A-37 threonylcarbamoyl transferase component Bud32